MKLMIRNLRKYKLEVFFVILLLLAQAACDLLLPAYTSKLIDVGIQNNGVEYAVPLRLTEEAYGQLGLFLDAAEAQLVADAYERTEDGCYAVRYSDKETLAQMDTELTEPVFVLYTLSRNADSDYTVPTGDALAAMTPAEYDQAHSEALRRREESAAEIAVVGEDMLHSSAVAWVSAAYEAAGAPVDAVRSAYLWEKGLIMLLLALLLAATSVVLCYVSSRIGAGVGRDMRSDVFSRVLSFSSNEMNSFSTASLITRTTNDIQQIQFVTVMLLRIALYAPVMSIGGAVMVAKTSPALSWIIFLAIGIILVILAILSVTLLPKFKKMQTMIDGLNRISRELLSGVQVIRAFGREKEEERRFDKSNVELTKTMLFTTHAVSILAPLLMLMMYGFSALVIWAAAPRIDAGTLEVGQMTAFITYAIMVVAGFLMISATFVILPRAAVAAKRINEVIRTQSTIADPAEPVSIENCRGEIAFRDVSFRYPGASEDTLSNISFTASPGKVTAIVGGTGSGKSTVLRLIERFYDVTGGAITLDGIDIRRLSLQDLRRRMGYVPQKGILFSGTIASNIRFGADSISDPQMEAAAAIAQATDFIGEKPERYETAIAQGGTNVSGGQKQRLSIARAIAKAPQVYLFDDSFSALDYKTDTALRRALSEHMQDAAVLIVAQRISTVLHADTIVVLDEGRMVGIGTHAQLLETNEIYRQIAVSQLSEAELGLGKEVSSNG